MSQEENDYFESIRVDGNPHLFLIHDQLEVGTYWFGKDRMTIVDPVWNTEVIGTQFGDQVLLELSKHPLVRRTMSIEQLTLDPYTETIPNGANFSRWEHMWGSVVFVRKMAESLGLDDKQRLILQLRTFVSDLGHTAYSHLGDWMFQGVGGDENQHDNELMRLLEVSGVNDILRANAIQPEEVVFPSVEDWIECPSPDLCVDRVDYGAREIRRWLDLSFGVHEATTLDAFKIDKNGRLVMTNYESALAFSKAFLLLPTEHWSEPIHRLQLSLLQQLVKRVLTNPEVGLFASSGDAPNNFFLRDYLYSFDFDITWEQLRSWDEYTTIARTTMEEIGRYRRRYFVSSRKGQLGLLFDSNNESHKFPLPTQKFGTLAEPMSPIPPNITLIPVEKKEDVKDFNRTKKTFDVYLPSLKSRFVDPLFIDKEGAIQRLSQYDKNFKRLLAQQKKIMAQAYVARIHLNERTVRMFKDTDKKIECDWNEALTFPRMKKNDFNHMLGEIAMLSRNHKLINVGLTDLDGLDLYSG